MNFHSNSTFLVFPLTFPQYLSAFIGFHHNFFCLLKTKFLNQPLSLDFVKVLIDNSWVEFNILIVHPVSPRAYQYFWSHPQILIFFLIVKFFLPINSLICWYQRSDPRLKRFVKSIVLIGLKFTDLVAKLNRFLPPHPMHLGYLPYQTHVPLQVSLIYPHFNYALKVRSPLLFHLHQDHWFAFHLSHSYQTLHLNFSSHHHRHQNPGPSLRAFFLAVIMRIFFFNFCPSQYASWKVF